MSKTKKSKTFIKIIYFDEGSATDLLYILGGGKSTDKEEKIVTKTTQLAAGAEAQAGAKINLLTKITAGMGIDGSADASREGRSILSKAIESTVLTDYIRCTENEAKSHITVFTKCKPYAFPGSFTYFKTSLLFNSLQKKWFFASISTHLGIIIPFLILLRWN